VSARTTHSGFTIIELLMTLGILSVLATIAVPVAQLQIQRRKEYDFQLALRELRSAIDAYKQASDAGAIRMDALASGYPENLAILVDGVVDQRDPEGREMYFLRRIPRDPFATDAKADAADTWNLRSYQSEADAPQPGKDVYDVYSKSTLTGLNGVPYALW
jgi:general secretion pathway protein G